MSNFSCFIIGNGALALRCLEILLREKNRILGVYSTDDSLQQWAGKHSISYTSSQASFQEQLLSAEYDYLFSINNTSWIIPSEILLKARKVTINYHDSPLPKYAGLHATSWALIHGETQHAVTWHEVDSEIDAGDILKQKAVPILEDDTAFSLNTRCFDIAISSFDELVQELKTDQVKVSTQDLSQRSYFGPSTRPAAACLLSFDQNTKDLYNLVRGLDFGPIQNPLGLAKVWLPGGIVTVGSVAPVVTSYGVSGEVLKLDKDGVEIAAADGVVRLSGFATLEGKSLSVDSLKVEYGCQVGSVLPALNADVRGAISQRNVAICPHEQAWVGHLKQLVPFRHPYAQVDTLDALHLGDPIRYPILLPPNQLGTQSWLAMFAAYCARLATEPKFDLGLQTDAQRSIAPKLFAQSVPIRIQTQTEESFTCFQKRFEAALIQVSQMGSYSLDIFARYPELRDSQQSQSLPVVLVLAASPEQLDWKHLGAMIALVAYEDGNPPEVVHSGILNEVRARAIVSQLESLMAACIEHPEQIITRLPLLSTTEKKQLLVDWNQTAKSFSHELCLHQLFEEQATRHPDKVAVAFELQQLTYKDLNERANQLAHYLRNLGVGPDVIVGLHMERSLEMMVGLLGIHKAGGAYVPVDPDFPQERIQYMLQDCQAPVILTQQRLVPNLAVARDTNVVAINTMWRAIAQQAKTNLDSGVKPEHLSYVIYTSGSTGRPKGVMVEHRNVVNFFTGMDDSIGHNPLGVWLAVTSLSFDISVLELFWTLARGFKVVIYNPKQAREPFTAHEFEFQHAEKTIDFSLFYFSSHEAGEDAADKYRLLLEGAKFGDAHGFQAIWTPERHFHAFGGLFPNPAVTSAALAAITGRIQIRAGSCVSPLHNPARLTEDWSVVDNLSKGRVGISFAAGWQPNDFVLRPETFQDRKAIMFDQIEEVRSLWRGESVTYLNGKGEHVEVKTLPRPIQPELPVWITAAGNPETFQMAGAKGFHLLTHLLGQTLDELAEKIAIYRQAWVENGHAGEGTVTLMLHTFVGESDDTVRELVRQPMRQYLASSLNLIKLAAWSFPTFKQKTRDEMGQFSVTHLSQQEWDEVLDFSFERYFESSGLFGTVESCLQKLDQIKGIGVNEIACLIDYGVDTDAVLAQLPLLNQVKERANARISPDAKAPDNSLASLIQQHQVTHLQCTPSMASMLIADTATREAMKQLNHMMVGGEAFPEALATQLRQIIPGQIHNMYGPTETTIWSTTYTLERSEGIVPIGQPIANTELYVLDDHRQPVPIGVAGELFIGGKGVTRGYLNRPELTQERFVTNPFSPGSGERLYRTGDLVRYRSDGILDFLGRADFQVKVRGYRIELGEIETILSRHEAIREAVIVAREDAPGDKRLVAYVIAQAGQSLSSSVLREYLLSQIPEYMVPSHFVMLDAFPLTPNHKVNRKALPAPELAHSTPGKTKIGPRTPIEETLIDIWQELLLVSDIGIEDNFFELGGNSLIAVQLINKVQAGFEVNMSLMGLFKAPTVSDLAQSVETLLIEHSVSDDLTAMIENLQQLSADEVEILLQR